MLTPEMGYFPRRFSSSVSVLHTNNTPSQHRLGPGAPLAMPGVPRSRGCEQCKKRKVKCDENWPVCHNCTRRKLACSGPTTLMKFVVNGQHVVDQTSLRPASPSKKIGNIARSLDMLLMPQVSLRRGRLPDNGSGSLMCFRLPSPSPLNVGPTTVADRVAARLIYQLDTPGEQLITRTPVLAHIPKRMSENESLRDSIDLLCSVWSSYRSGDAPEEFIGMPMYGKALRSLSRALNSNQAFTVETLASIAILQRAESLFDPGRRPLMHEKGIAILLSKIGPPNPEDRFHSSVFTETYGIMLPYWLSSGWNPIFDQPPWRETIARGFADSVGVEELKPSFHLVFIQTNKVCQKLSALLQAFQSVFEPGPRRFSATSSFVAKMTQEFSDAEGSLKEAITALFDKGIELGAVTEEEYHTPITQTRYTFSSTHLALLVVSYFTVHLFLLRLRYQWSAEYGLPDAESLYLSFKDACVNIWKFVPFLQDLKLFISGHLQGALALSFGVADEKEREYILDIFEVLENYGLKVPRSREQLRDELSHRNTTLRISTGEKAYKSPIGQEKPLEAMPEWIDALE